MAINIPGCLATFRSRNLLFCQNSSDLFRCQRPMIYAGGFALHRCRLESNLNGSGRLFQVKLLMTVSLSVSYSSVDETRDSHCGVPRRRFRRTKEFLHIAKPHIAVHSDFLKCGFIVNEPKSCWEPRQDITWLHNKYQDQYYI